MSDVLCQAVAAERFKLLVHLAAFGVAAMCAGYNVMAYGQRRERRLALNVAVYAAVLGFEAVQVLRHADALEAR